jgi:hypothetical protein
LHYFKAVFICRFQPSWTHTLNITSQSQLSFELWNRALRYSAFVAVVIAIAALRLVSLENSSAPLPTYLVELSFWRLFLLLSFHTAPLSWASLIYKGYKQRRISIPLYQTMRLLRMPIAAWSAGCLLAALVLWPQLNV